MSPAWWITDIIIALYVVNFFWLIWHDMPWAGLYWFFAAGITVCAMKALTEMVAR